MGRTFGLNHVYADDDIYDVKVVVMDDEGAKGFTVVVVTVDNTDPVVFEVSVEPETVKEGDTVSLTGKFKDPGVEDRHEVVIDWDNGHSSAEPITLDDGVWDFTAFHTGENAFRKYCR